MQPSASGNTAGPPRPSERAGEAYALVVVDGSEEFVMGSHYVETVSAGNKAPNSGILTSWIL
jgi:hypothetical protein